MKKNQMEYKGYLGSVEWSETDGVFYGKLLDVNGVFSYDGEDMIQLRKGFQMAVNDYVRFCKENNINPSKEYKGSFNIRIGSELHKLAANRAIDEGISLNKLMCKALNVYLSE